MKIKEVAEVTGLTSKAIRMYEEKGLVRVKRDDNAYRVFDKESVAVLKEIKLYRYLNIPISEIRKFFDDKISVSELLENRVNELAILEKQISNQKQLCLSLIEDYDTENRNKCVGEYLETICYLESDAYELDQKSFNRLIRGRWDIHILMTLVLLSPILSFAIDISEQDYDNIMIQLIVSFAFTVLLTLLWVWFVTMRIKYKSNGEKEHSSLTIITLIGCLMLTFMLFGIIQVLQVKLFATDNYIASGINDEGVYSLFFFEIELLVFMFIIISSKFKISFIEDIKSVISGRGPKKIGVAVLLVANVVAFLICIFAVTIVEEENIHVRSIKNILGNTYELDRVEKVETGYYTSGKENGTFFYNLTMKDGMIIHINSCTPNEKYVKDNSYLWLLELDDQIMAYSPPKIVDRDSDNGSYNYAEKYKNVFRDIMTQND